MSIEDKKKYGSLINNTRKEMEEIVNNYVNAGGNTNVYYSSMMVSNLGSLHCGAIFHNINDFGTCSSLATMGEMHDEEVLINGKKEIRKLTIRHGF